MSKEYRPYYIKRAITRFEEFYTDHFLKPRFTYLGEGTNIVCPWNVQIFGPTIELGKYANIVASSDNKVRILVWPETGEGARIKIGDYTIISPGVRICAAREITIGPNCMIAHRSYITDCDWHGTIDRVYSMGEVRPVILEENVWIGDSAIVCKGVTIGKNSIIGAGAVVVKDIPPCSVAVGNPAAVVKQLDPDASYATRAELLAEPDELIDGLKRLERHMLQKNTMLGWIRHLLFPTED